MKKKRCLVLALIICLVGAAVCQASLPSLGNHKLLIITPEKLALMAIALRNHKNDNGMPAEVLMLPQIYANFAGADEPEKIKNAIDHFHDTKGTEYVLLLGDSDLLPVRYTARSQDYGDDPRQFVFGNTDLYYADLTKLVYLFWLPSTWNVLTGGHHTRYFGELFKKGAINRDAADMLPEVAVGRVPASDLAEAAHYVDKVVRFETQGCTRAEAMVAALDDFAAMPGSESLARDLEQAGFSVSRLYREDFASYARGASNPPTTPRMVAGLSASRLVGIFGHGGRSGWGGLFDTTDVSTLGNSGGGCLPVVFASACDVAGYARKEGEVYMDTDRARNPLTGGGILTAWRFDGPDLVLQEKHARVSPDHRGTMDARKAAADARFRLAAGNVHPNAGDEIVAAVAYPGPPPKVALLRHRYSDQAGFVRIDKVEVTRATMPLVATADLDGGSEDEIVLGVQDGAGRLALLSYHHDPTDPAQQLIRRADLRIVGMPGCALATGDVSGDGRDEVVVARSLFPLHALLVYRYVPSTQSFELLARSGMMFSFRQPRVAVADMDDDGKGEIVLASENLAGQVVLSVHRRSSWALTQVSSVSLVADNVEALTAGNPLAGARQEAVVVLEYAAGRSAILVYELDGTGRLSRIGSARIQGTASSEVTLANADTDGADEIVYATRDGSGRGAMLVYDLPARHGLTRIGDGPRLPRSSTPTGLAAGDWDGGGAVDLAAFMFRLPDLPTPPAPIQPSTLDPESMAEALLVDHFAGAAAFIATNSGTQKDYVNRLGKELFHAYLTTGGDRVLGDMWKQAILRYYSTYSTYPVQNPACVASTDCHRLQAAFFHPAKTMLFGDPSLRIPAPPSP